MSGFGQTLLVALATVTLISDATVAGDGPDKQVKELKVLDQLAGSWTITQPGTRRKGQSTSQWILAGRVLQTNSRLTDGSEMLILRTYDPSLRKYIVSIWDSRGMAIILSGDWDPQEKTLTAKSEAGRTVISAVSKMRDEDTEQWQVQFTDFNGKTLRKVGGTNRRQSQ